LADEEELTIGRKLGDPVRKMTEWQVHRAGRTAAGPLVRLADVHKDGT